MAKKILCALVLTMCTAMGLRRAMAEDPPAAPPASAEDVQFFNTKIKPILETSCYKCHSAKSTKIKGKLRLDGREWVLKGGEDGDVVVPGKPDDSLLIKDIRWEDPDQKMPPKKKLTDEQIADMAQWVKMGVPFPPDEK